MADDPKIPLRGAALETLLRAEGGVQNDESAPARMVLRSGYSAEAEQRDRTEVLVIRAPTGEACLEIVLTPEGPTVRLRSASLEIAAQGSIKLDCQRLDISAVEDISLRAGRHLVQHASGDVAIHAQGAMVSEANEHLMRARLGDMRLLANDDVMLDGERVRLNSPKEGQKPIEAARTFHGLHAAHDPKETGEPSNNS